MGLFNKKKDGGFRDVIRCDEPSYLIWKWHPGAKALGESKRENSIRTSSVLRVKDGEVAVFVYKQKDGTMQDFIEGPFDKTIKTGNFPILESIIGLFYEGDTPFQAEVYFINLAKVVQVKFGVPYFNVCDPRNLDFSVPVAVRGTITFKIDDYKNFIKCHRLNQFDLSTFQNQIRDTLNRYVKDIVANAPVKHNIPVVHIESRTGLINEAAEPIIKEKLKEIYGVSVTSFDIGTIEIDKTSDEYNELKRITKDVTIEMTEQDLQYRKATQEQNIYAQQMATRNANIGAYTVEKQAEVGVAGAEALGKMGANGVGNVNLGNGTGFNPVSMMAGMTLGGAVGQNIANTMNNAMQGSTGNTTPPPIPKVTYFVAKNGQSTGPFDMNKLSEMIMSGELKKDSFVWKQGMSSWTTAETVDDLKTLFPPEIPR